MNPEQILSELGYESFKSGQLEVIEKVLDRQDILALFPTGYGKSLIYRVASKLASGATIVISPLISLMKDQVDFTLRFDPGWATFLNSSLAPHELRKRIWDVANGRYKMVYVAPERLRSAGFSAILDYLKAELLVVDEAHCVTMWGHDFRPDYLLIKDVRSRFSAFLALTATASPSMISDIVQDLGGKLKVYKPVPIVRDNFRIKFLRVRNIEEKLQLLFKLLKKDYKSGIIYTTTRQEADFVAGFLRSMRLRAASYHAGLGPEQRTARQDAFMNGEIKYLAATTAFGMGIDKPDIELILHWSIPESIESYYQEIGRGGRDGRMVDAVMFLMPSDIEVRRSMIARSLPSPSLAHSAFRWIMEHGTWIGEEVVFDPDTLLRELDMEEDELRLILAVADSADAIRWEGNVTSRVTVHDPAEREIDLISQALLQKRSPFDIEKELWLAHFRNDIDLKQSGKILFRAYWKNYVTQNSFQHIINSIRERKLDGLNKMLAMAGANECRLVYLRRYFGDDEGTPCGVCDVCLRKEPLLHRKNGGSLWEKTKMTLLKFMPRLRVREHEEPPNLSDSSRSASYLMVTGRAPIARPKRRRLRLPRLRRSRGDSQVKAQAKSVELIKEYMNEEHPTEIGGRNFYGFFIDYRYKFTSDGRRFSDTYERLISLRNGKRAWNRDYLVHRLKPLFARFDADGVIVPVHMGDENGKKFDVVELISEDIARETGRKIKRISELERGDFAILLFDEFRTSRKTIELIERIHRLTGNKVGVIGIIYRR